MVRLVPLFLAFWAILGFSTSWAKISEATETCLSCHESVTPGIVADWKKSVHAQILPGDILSKKYNVQVPKKFAGVVVGCAECHTQNHGAHKDTFDHNGFKVHKVVTPRDCATCHPHEVAQYQKNKMSHAYNNLLGNPVYHGLVEASLGPQSFKEGKLIYEKTSNLTKADACLHCHGTKVEVKGKVVRDTDFGEMEFVDLAGWPNNGVGRINPDGSMGSCTSCHPRHGFSIEVARKPYTCSECHKGPDVPGYKVYMVSKHGNIFSSKNHEWNFKPNNWTVGKDFTAPTCAACHISQLVDADGNIIVKRTHQMNDRLAWRIFGLIYAHPQPKDPDTTKIKNKAGLPLPTELTGEPVEGYLISKEEMAKRRATMKKVCLACHAEDWVEGHFAKLDKSIETTNKQTLAATLILLEAWNAGVAKGLPSSIFDEAIEKMWVEQWLFYANSTRYASAMAGADYGAFANGRWYLNKNLQQMLDWLGFLKAAKKAQ
ncbi:multiheme c-type cytochrome [Thermodesulfatator autotrophicus]|uniref:Hydroxylamine oxidase n=1 Tax=Thermodesulfatator autotrophicus TaxID=1795632 RepID=A0A177E9B4_9BACT|nr:multiheme c-type cytochrome [Thermodesulfatator autotrophicus]OAG28398.1 hydroxylamine oxidase [Thermodesulfatator autotrophicus]